MEKSVFLQARDLPPEKWHAAEVLLGGQLSEDELVLIGDALAEAYRQLFDWSAEMSKRVEGVPASEFDTAVEQALEFARPGRG
jgi:hypothetical protein